MTSDTPILRLAIPSPLRRRFDYLPPAGVDVSALRPGMRVRVPFARGEKIGLLLELAGQAAVPRHRLKPALAVLDEEPLFDPPLLDWLCWVNDYYHHAIGDTVFTALPRILRRGEAATVKAFRCWRLTEEGLAQQAESLVRAPRQAALLALLRRHPQGLTPAELEEAGLGSWRSAMQALRRKGWVSSVTPLWPAPTLPAAPPAMELNAEQAQVVAALDAARGRFTCFLLDGVTGSGKTEVYLALIERVLAAGQQALLLLPEIGLTPQLVGRFEARFGRPVAVLHSGLSDSERLRAWLAAREGRAGIVIGTRSAVFTPFARLGVIIVDEEHDASLKQQEGLRYHARDIAVARAHRLGIPIVLGSATPSLESMANVRAGRFRLLRLSRRAGGAEPPRIERLDLKHLVLRESLAEALLRQAAEHLERGEQVLLFLNRRGYAPTLICHQCGWVGQCRRCDSHLTLHRGAGRLRCHHCGAESPVPRQCPQCGNPDIRAQGFGTERIEAALREYFPAYPVIRIDRDTTRRKGSLQALLTQVRHGEGQILLGTQMLAKGHDFPNVTLVAILDADQGLFSTDFRATERLAQLIVQVAGRAGRARKRGRVVIQTHHPDHPLLETLVEQGYEAFAQAALEERRLAALPPFRYAALFRAEAAEAGAPLAFLEDLAGFCRRLAPAVDCLGPAPSPMERRAGRYRAQVLLLAAQRQLLHRAVASLIDHIEQEKQARRVRWSVDVDPQDLS